MNSFLNITNSQLRDLVEKLNTTELRRLVSHKSMNEYVASTYSKMVSEITPNHSLAKLNREELISFVVELIKTYPLAANHFYEGAFLSPKQARSQILELDNSISGIYLKKILQLLINTYQHGNQPIKIPFSAIVKLFSIGISKVISEIEDLDLNSENPRLNIRVLQSERHRRNEIDELLFGIGNVEATPFHPDDFQLEAVELVSNQNIDVIVSAPTGAGKTWIAEEAIRAVLHQGQRAWYTSPLKALSNDKFREFGKIFGEENVGIITGDRSINSDAGLIIATTEIYRNRLYDLMNGVEGYNSKFNIKLVVFDEVHYLNDRDRGLVWEESIIYTPLTVRILMLSATLGNAEELAAWVSWARSSPCQLISHPDRPVPLRTAFVDAKMCLSPLFNDSTDKLHPNVESAYKTAFSKVENNKKPRRFHSRRR